MGCPTPLTGGSPVFVVPPSPPRPTAPIPRPPDGATARAPAAPPRQPIVRAQAPDEAPPAKVAIPSPAQLGVTASRPREPEADWKTTRRRLDELGAEGFHLERLSPGGFRFTCWVPGGTAGKPQRVEGQGATEAEAIRVTLDRAERLRGSRP